MKNKGIKTCTDRLRAILRIFVPFFHFDWLQWLNDDLNKLCLGENWPEEGKLTTKVTCEIELKWIPKKETLSLSVWGPYLPYLFRFSPELIVPTTLWLKQALFGQKRTHTRGVMTKEGLVLLCVGCDAATPFVVLIVCGAGLTWSWCVCACLVVMPMSRTQKNLCHV